MLEIIKALVPYIITAVATITVAVIEGRSSKERKKTVAEMESMSKRGQLRAEESMISLEMSCAACKLGVVTAKAVTHQHTNGDVEKSMEAAEKAVKHFDSFKDRIAKDVMAEAHKNA